MEDKIQLSIQSDGTSEGTIVRDQDGRTLDNVIRFDWSLDLDGNPQTTLTLVGVPVSITYNAKITSLEELEELHSQLEQ